MSLARSSATVGSLTLVSRLLGFVRDMLVAHFLGASFMSDALLVAFKLPNFLRRLFAEGAFNAGFLPMFVGMAKTEGEEKAVNFASEAGSFLMWVVLTITVLAMIFMPHLMFVLAPGFEGEPEKFALTVALTRITMPYILFISMVSLLGGVLNSFDKFAATAATPIGMNLSLILGLWIFRPFVATDAHAFAWAIILAGLVQFFWLVSAARRRGVMPVLWRRPRLTPQILRLLGLIGPAAIGAGVQQINLLMDTWFASRLGDAVSFLYYADRLFELPLGVIGIAVYTALLPLLSREIKSGARDAAIRHLNQAMQIVMLLGLPSAVALFALSHPIIRVIFQQGRFSAANTAMVAPALAAFAIGLPAHLLVKVFSSCYYASQDTKTPVKVAIVCVTANFLGNVILMQYLAHVGLALSTTISGFLNATLLGIGLYRKGYLRPDPALLRFFAKDIAACAIMGALLFEGSHLMAGLIEAETLAVRVIGLTLLIGTGGVTYFALMIALRAVDPRNLKRLLRPRAVTAGDAIATKAEAATAVKEE